MTIHKLKVDTSGVIVDSILSLRDTVKNRSASNRGGWQLEIKPRRFDRISWILQFLLRVEKELKNIYPDYHIHRFWFNINGPGHSNEWHNHGSKEIVGVAYIQTDELSGDIEFKDSNTISPKVGDLLIFPSELDHRVSVSQSNNFRISIAFNFNKRKKHYLERICK
jgi:hypothetical protein